MVVVDGIVLYGAGLPNRLGRKWTAYPAQQHSQFPPLHR